MTPAPLTVDLTHDIVCPWCRIGHHNLRTALSRWLTDLLLRRGFQRRGVEPATVLLIGLALIAAFPIFTLILPRLLLGSVATQVVHLCTKPVVVVR